MHERRDCASTSRCRRVRAAAIAMLFAAFAATATYAANGSVVYAYDALGRITSVSYDTGVIVIYTYDAAGNRTSQVINANATTLTWTITSTPCTANCWGASLW